MHMQEKVAKLRQWAAEHAFNGSMVFVRHFSPRDYERVLREQQGDVAKAIAYLTEVAKVEAKPARGPEI